MGWYPSHLPERERKLLKKLDLVLLTYSFLTFFSKSLDANNLRTAYVSGLKEDLSMYGNELNKLTVIYQIGYSLGQIPCVLLLSRPQFSKYLLPSFEVLYAFLTILQSQVTNVNQLYVLRFFTAVFESPVFTGLHFVLGKYYNASTENGGGELFLRSGVWFTSSALASIASGNLQSFAFKNLNGVYGMRSWQWLFCLDFAITVPIALLGFLLWPGIPESGKKFYFDDDEYMLIMERSNRFGIKKARKLTWYTFKRGFTDWRLIAVTLGFTMNSFIWNPTGSLSLWMKAQGTFTIPQINIYPTIHDYLALTFVYLSSYLSNRLPLEVLYTAAIAGPLFLSILMTSRIKDHVIIFFGYFISSTISISSPLYLSFANLIFRHDSELNALAIGSMMTSSQLVIPLLAWWVYPVKIAPEWKFGWPASLIVGVISIWNFNRLAKTIQDDTDDQDRGIVEFLQDQQLNGQLYVSDNGKKTVSTVYESA